MIARRLRFPVLVAAVLVASVAIACSDDGGDSGDPTAAPPSATVSAASSPASASSATPASASTPAATATTAAVVCENPALTPAQTEGPYWTAGSPERASLLDPGMAGTRLVLTGVVVDEDCRPIAGALLDFWQADADGAYDNAGYTLRGRQTADANGAFRLETVVPGEYPGRTPHIHVKITPPGGATLTTQLYLDVESNASDGIFDPALIMDATQTASGVDATFMFVVPRG